MQKIFRNTVAKINLAHCRHNIKELKALAGSAAYFCAMVKANAYGHGDYEISKIALDEGASSVGVAIIEEGIRLRTAGIENNEILVFHPHIDELAAKTIIEYALTPVVSSWPSLLAMQKAAAHRKYSIHIKLNTGMNRLGFAIGELELLTSFLKTQSALVCSGICTHYLNGEDWGEVGSYTEAQSYTFTQALKFFSGLDLKIHAYNSSSLISGYCTKRKNEYPFGARPGISVYGIKPNLICKNHAMTEIWNQIDLKPVMSVHTEIALTQKANAGDVVSYGAEYQCTKDSLIGILPIGYADGYRRLLSNKGHVLCAGQQIPVVGRVCMDTTMVNLTELKMSERDALGQEIIIIGQQGEKKITADDLAALIDTNTYEIFTGFSERLQRVYI